MKLYILKILIGKICTLTKGRDIVQNFMKTIISAVQTWTKGKIKDSTADWNENDSSKDSYVRNRTHWEEEKEIVVVSEQTVEGFAVMQDPIYVARNAFSMDIPVVGETYTVNWDGADYRVVAQDGDDLIYLGNENYVFSMTSGGDIPFAIIFSDVIFVATESDATSHTISISTTQTVVHKLDSKFINLPESSNIGKEGTGTGAEIFNDYEENIASGDYSHAEGSNTTASGDYSHAEGSNTTASGVASHAEGTFTTASGHYSHAEGTFTTASGYYSHAEGGSTEALARDSHAEGRNTTASGFASHAEGYYTTVFGDYSHAEGKGDSTLIYLTGDANSTTYKTDNVRNDIDVGHILNYNNQYAKILSYDLSTLTITTDTSLSSSALNRAKVYLNKLFAYGEASHAEGKYTTASGNISHAEGYETIASGENQHVQGKYNIENPNYAHVVGNGKSETNRSNAHTLDWDGNAWYQGDVYVGGTSQDDSKKLATEQYVDEAIANFDDAGYVEVNFDGVEESDVVIPVNADTLGGYHPGKYRTAYNLLDNSDFRNPVNQRGVTNSTSIAKWSYLIDRWKNGGEAAHIFNLNSNGLMLEANTTILQYLNSIPTGTVLTAAIMLSDETIIVASGAVVYNSDGTWIRFAIKNDSGVMVSLATFDEKIEFSIYTASGTTVKWAALYEGEYTAETLPEYMPKGYAHELAECKRYFQRFGSTKENMSLGIGVARSTTTLAMILYLGAMRDTPKMSYSGTVKALSNVTVTGLKPTLDSYMTVSGTQRINFVSSGFTVGYSYLIASESNGFFIEFSADL